MSTKFIPEHTDEITQKRQIVLFHSPIQNISHYYIDKNGVVELQLDDKKWCKQLDIDLKTFEKNGVSFRYLDKSIIGITLENYGPAEYKNYKFYSKYYYPDEPLRGAFDYCKTPWRGYQYWEYYYEKQLESLRELLLSLCERHSIPKTYNADIWDVSRRALMGTPGIFCRCSFIKDAHDLHPQIELINMLKSL